MSDNNEMTFKTVAICKAVDGMRPEFHGGYGASPLIELTI